MRNPCIEEVICGTGARTVTVNFSIVQDRVKCEM